MYEYSVDKIKLFFYGIDIRDIQKMMNKLSTDVSVGKSYESKTVASCRYNYILDNLKGKCYLGIEPNWLTRSVKGKKDIVLEYNPNKIFIEEFESIRELKFYDIRKVEIMSIDIARDIYTHKVNELLIHKRHGNEYFAKMGHSCTETIYVGTFGSNGAVRIYNKAKEQKIKDKEFIWTRFEIRYKKPGFMDIKNEDMIREIGIPKIYASREIVNEIAFKELKGLDKYLYLTSIDNIENLELLDRRMKKKILDYHKQINLEIKIDLDEIINVYKNFEIL